MRISDWSQTCALPILLATQTLLLSQAKTMEIRVEGSLGYGISAKDVILAIVGRIGAAGGTGHVIEYNGSVIRAMSRSEERRVGKECVRTCRCRGWPNH